MVTRNLGRSLLAVAVLLGLTGCPGPDVSNPDPNDATPPTLTFGSLGLRREVTLTADGGPATLRLRAADSIQLLSQAKDAESGIAEVAIRGRLEVACYPSGGTKKIVVAEPIAQVTVRKDASSFPSDLIAALPMSGSRQRAQCPAGSQFGEVTGSLTASATNTAGRVAQLGPLSVRSFGPDLVRVAEFNLYQPGHHPDEVYVAWGNYLRDKADVLLLSEVPDQRRADLIANAAGLTNVIVHADVAIASRARIRDVYRFTVDPPNTRLDSANSNLLVVETDLGNYPHRVAAAHFGIRDAGDELFDASRSAPGRLEAANRIIAELDSRDGAEPAIVGGDFNAYSGVGPQDQPGATAEVTALRDRYTDPLTVLTVPPGDLCGQRIDYILVNGYVPSAYKQDCTANEPSDHPMVLAVVEAN
jgi:endonuclease/exonuclease/phosphatase family metal-dependent hydrolase